MNKRLKRKMKFARERGIFVGPSLNETDNKYVRYDIWNEFGPCGFRLDLHTAINLAFHQSIKARPKLKVYILNSDGKWHRSNCVEVGGEKKCSCHYLKNDLE